jgi:hypothetical protein
MISKTCNVRAERLRLTATSNFFKLVMRDGRKCANVSWG